MEEGLMAYRVLVDRDLLHVISSFMKTSPCKEHSICPVSYRWRMNRKISCLYHQSCDPIEWGNFRKGDSAAGAGFLNVIQTFRSQLYFSHHTITEAAKNNQFEVLKWLDGNMNEIICTTDPMDVAAENGHFDILKWLHNHKRAQCTTNAMDKAAENGHFDILKWLHDHTDAGCTVFAMDGAAKSGHFEILKWLHINRTEGCKSALIQALQGGDIEIAEWLHNNRTGINDLSNFPHFGIPSCIPKKHVLLWVLQNYPSLFPEFKGRAIETAASEGDLETIKLIWKISPNKRDYFLRSAAHNAVMWGHIHVLEWFLLKNPGLIKDQLLPETAAEYGHLDILKMFLQKGGNINSCIVQRALVCGHLEVVKWMVQSNIPIPEYPPGPVNSPNTELVFWLHENNVAQFNSEAMDSAACWGNFELLKWLHKNRTEGCTSGAMSFAALNGHLEIVKWLHFNRTEGCTVDAMNYAATYGQFEILKWLHFNRTEGCTVDAMDGAAERGYLEIVTWLHFNRSEGCTQKLMDKTDSIHVLQWAMKNRTEGCTTQVLQKENFTTLKWIFHNIKEAQSEEAIEAALSFHFLNPTARKWLEEQKNKLSSGK
jgi:hypothetical protein